MMKHRFVQDECGAVTTEFVVLVVAVILIPLAVASQVKTGTIEVANDVSDEMVGMIN